jgi:hypothetical protein
MKRGKQKCHISVIENLYELLLSHPQSDMRGKKSNFREEYKNKILIHTQYVWSH